jgi:hypothetical protein
VEYIWCISNIQKLTYLPFIQFCKGIAQTSCQLDPQLYFSNESHNSNFLNEKIGKTAYDAYRYSYAVVNVVGILGNILVIISILSQKKLLKNNYYFLVLHLAICDEGICDDNEGIPMFSARISFSLILIQITNLPLTLLCMKHEEITA